MPTNERRPRDDEIDVHGLTHPGKVRESNEDHFLICSLHKRLKVHATSLPQSEDLRFRGDRIAFIAVVADGVGGQKAGEEASRLALKSVAQYITESTECYYTHDPDQEQRFLEKLHETVMTCHAKVSREAEENPDLEGMATTLTLAIGSWPWGYVVQVGDSRCYQLHDGNLMQITRDQTVGQDLYDEGLLSTSELERSSWAAVLSSAIGGEAASPVTSRTRMHRNDVILLCSDGLTRHVSNERIREVLCSMDSAKQACEQLLAEALEGGGEDNITIVVGRVLHPDGPDGLDEDTDPLAGMEVLGLEPLEASPTDPDEDIDSSDLMEPIELPGNLLEAGADPDADGPEAGEEPSPEAGEEPDPEKNAS